jgi:hypothetical protein
MAMREVERCGFIGENFRVNDSFGKLAGVLQ